jgi:hypothetical protein
MPYYTTNSLFKEMIEHELDAQGKILCGRPKGWTTSEFKPGFHIVHCPKCAAAKNGVTKLTTVTKPSAPAAGIKPELRNGEIKTTAGGRPRKFSSNAERQRAYRQRQTAAVGGSEEDLD